jgi:predicted SprT family Zn-dependent metalloprotease
VRIDDAANLMAQLMQEHQLFEGGWRCGWNHRRRSLGLCQYSTKRIELSQPLALVNDEATIRNTILHEIAHALAGSSAGHGRVWQLMAVSIGARPERCNGTAQGVDHLAKWQATCPRCERIVGRFRKPRREVSCGQCAPGRFDRSVLFNFVEVR